MLVGDLVVLVSFLLLQVLHKLFIKHLHDNISEARLMVKFFRLIPILIADFLEYQITNFGQYFFGHFY